MRRSLDHGRLLLVTDLIFAGTIVVIATSAIAAVTCVLFWCLAPLRRRAKLRRGRRALLQRRAKGAPRRTSPRRPTTT